MMVWSSAYYLKVTVPQILAELGSFQLLLLDLHGNVAIIKSLLISLSNNIQLRSLTNIKTYKHNYFWIFF